jgi:hypothetical protein
MGIAVILGVVSCGNGDESGGSDDAPLPDPVEACAGGFTPCGGDVEGSWEVIDACMVEPVLPFSDSCPAATLTSTAWTVTGTVEFRNDETFETTGTMSAELFTRMPTACLNGTCEEFEADVAPPAEVGTTTCSTVGGNCDCITETEGAFLAYPDLSEYLIIGSEMSILEPGGGDGLVYDYCVNGDTLEMRISSGTNSITLTRLGT